MSNVNFVYNDGGRSKYFDAVGVGDCVTRAISIASGLDYLDVYTYLSTLNKKRTGKKSARNGVFKKDYHNYILNLGFEWVACSGIGTGCTMHLHKDELPSSGTLILRLSKHLAAYVDGKLLDTYDCSRDGTRCVYGYYIKK